MSGYTYAELRESYEGSDSFMSGHQILNPRSTKRTNRTEEFPWIRDKRAVNAFLTKRFPRLKDACAFGKVWVARARCKCNPCGHLRRAALWKHVIQDYLLAGETADVTAQNWNEEQKRHYEQRARLISAAMVRRVHQMIRQSIAGQRLDGKPRTFGRPGRPKKHD